MKAKAAADLGLEDGASLPPAEGAEEETDADVLALPSALAVAIQQELQLPELLSPSAELALKRACVSAADYLAEILSEQITVPDAVNGAAGGGGGGELTQAQCKLMVEDFVSRAADDRSLQSRNSGDKGTHCGALIAADLLYL